ncbi:MAG: CoA ester lyase [Bacillota bacterium]|nr:CoA ester lyase [Bacillota bacterium]
MAKIRRSMLFVPGDNPGMLLNAGVLGADSVIFDLEDAVSLKEKDSARILVRNALNNLEYGKTEKIVRINGLNTKYWKKDLDQIIPASPDAVMPPKIETAEEIKKICDYISKIEKEKGMEDKKIKIIPIIETSLGIENSFQIAKGSPRLEALFLGAEDLTANIGAKRTKKGDEIFYSRSRIIIAANAAGIQAVDTPYTDINDEEGLKVDAVFAKDMGFDGKASISPRHVETINKVFTPSKEEIEFAKEVIDAINRAEKEGRGVISMNGQMIDAPIVDRANHILSIYKSVMGGSIDE